MTAGRMTICKVQRIVQQGGHFCYIGYGIIERMTTEDAFLERVITTIREEAAKINPLGSLLQFVQTPSAQTPAEKENNTETEEAVLDFLDSF